MNRRTPRSSPTPSTALGLLLPLLLLLAAGCKASRKLYDPTLVLETDGGRELGASTEHGIVFLGRSARSGPVSIVAEFGDGPGIEASVIEPLGGGIFTAETEIRLPRTPMSFRTPKPGTEVTVKGRRGSRLWETKTRVVSDPDVDGLLLRPIDELVRDGGQVGAGVYVRQGGEQLLVGLVSGEIELVRPGGGRARYVTVIGPEDLWRLVTYRRDFPRKRTWVYREDIL
jgi:hypothetical protein